MNRQYLYVSVAMVAVVVLAHVFGSTKPAAARAPTTPAADTRMLS